MLLVKLRNLKGRFRTCVCHISSAFLSNALEYQDTRQRTEAQHAVRDNTEKIDKERAKLEKLEESLEEEECALDAIRDSLKGAYMLMKPFGTLTNGFPARQDPSIS